MSNNDELYKLKKYAIFMIVLFFISILVFTLVYYIDTSNVSKNEINKLNQNKVELEILNQTYQNLSIKKEILLQNYNEIDKLYLEIQNSYNQINSNTQTANGSIVLIQDKIAYYEAENIQVQNEIASLEGKLK